MSVFYRHEDWTLFRQIGTLCQKAGVTPDWLQRLVLKELVDNSLDACGDCRVGRVSERSFIVEDDGPGIDPSQVPDLFSIRRPLTSSKLCRLPSRGALGNGLRVVVGVSLASSGTLIVETRGRRLVLQPQDDGSTLVAEESTGREQGLRVELTFGPSMPQDRDSDPTRWADRAIKMAGTTPIFFAGRTSPYWEDAAAFYERCQATRNVTVRELISEFDGCSGRKAGEITADLKGRLAESLTRDETAALLQRARERVVPIRPNRLRPAKLSGVDMPGYAYACERGSFNVDGGNRLPNAKNVPFTVEVFAAPAEVDEVEICVNRTPAVAEVDQVRQSDKTEIVVFGCGLAHGFKVGRQSIRLIINVQTPFMPITSDGKAPDLERFDKRIRVAVEKAARGCQRANRGRGKARTSQKAVVLAHLDAAIAKASGDGVYRYSQRQLFYAVRPYLLESFGKEPQYETFCRILTEFEASNGDLPGMYRDPRGIVYHPHLHEEIPLGTINVEEYKRPPWTFNKILYCEKEGFFPILRSVSWPEMYDCALLTSKGTASRAARDLLDHLGETGEEITFFAIHDADAYGTNIYHALQEATAARGARKVKIINLGLEPWEGIAMGLSVEKVERSKERRPVAPYVRERTDDDWTAWLQVQRIELNAMTTPQILAWLSRKLEDHGHHKVIPPQKVLEELLDEKLRENVEADVIERILAQNNADEQIRQAILRLGPGRDKLVQQLTDKVSHELAGTPTHPWTSPIERFAAELAHKGKGGL